MEAGAAPRNGERRRGIDRVIMLLDALLRHRVPMRVGDIAKAIGAPRSTTYEIVNSLLEAEMLENVGPEGHVYFGRAMHLFGWAYSHHNAHYRRIIETLDKTAAETGETVQLCGLRGNKYIVLDCRDYVALSLRRLSLALIIHGGCGVEHRPGFSDLHLRF